MYQEHNNVGVSVLLLAGMYCFFLKESANLNNIGKH